MKAAGLFALMLVGCGGSELDPFLDDGDAGADVIADASADVTTDVASESALEDSGADSIAAADADATALDTAPDASTDTSTSDVGTDSDAVSDGDVSEACVVESVDDVHYASKDAVLFTLDRDSEFVATYATTRTMSYENVSFVLRRVGSLGAFAGDVTFTLYSGRPDTGLTKLASGKLASTFIAAMPSSFAISMSTMSGPFPIGTQLSVGITTSSSAYKFEVWGGGASAFPPAPAKMSWWHRSFGPPTTPFVEDPTTDPALQVRGTQVCP